jgi:hypothetical protein
MSTGKTQIMKTGRNETMNEPVFSFLLSSLPEFLIFPSLPNL